MVFSPDNGYLAIVDVVGLYVSPQLMTAATYLNSDLADRSNWLDEARDTIEFSPDSAISTNVQYLA